MCSCLYYTMKLIYLQAKAINPMHNLLHHSVVICIDLTQLYQIPVNQSHLSLTVNIIA